MAPDLVCDYSLVEIRVAVETTMGTGVVGSDINAGNTAALRSLIGILFLRELLSHDSRDELRVYALAVPNAKVCGKVGLLAAGL